MEKNNQTKNKERILLGILFIAFLLILFQIVFFFYPALLSTKGNCLQNATKTYSQNPLVLGAVIRNESGIFLYINPNVSKGSYDYNSILKHEMCHVEQYKENRTFTCNNKFGVFMNEMECYIKENLP